MALLGSLRKEPDRPGTSRRAQGIGGRAARDARRYLRGTALETAERLAEKWRQKGYPKVSEHVEEHIGKCMACLVFPGAYRRRIRTTNGLKRINHEIKRRTRVVRIFSNRQACL